MGWTRFSNEAGLVILIVLGIVVVAAFVWYSRRERL